MNKYVAIQINYSEEQHKKIFFNKDFVDTEQIFLSQP